MRTQRALLCLAALVAACFATPTTSQADGLIIVTDHVIVAPHGPRHPRPTPVPRPRHWPRPEYPLRVTKHHVNVAIDGGVARTRVLETFHNPNARQLEGKYIFPLPPGASISNFEMTMNGKLVEGEVLEKDKARTIYEDIVRRLKDPGLLEYVDRGLFQARVFPIPANGDINVAISYEESLRSDHGHSRYRYPLDTGKYSAGDYRNVLIDVSMTSRAPIRNVSCPSHDAQIIRTSDTAVRVTFEATALHADRDFVVDWNVSEDALAPLVLTYRGSEQDRFFLLSLSPKIGRVESVPPKDLVIVLDTSGSMLGPKMEHARRAVKHFVHGLNDGDRFNIVDFASEGRRFRDSVVPASADNRSNAMTYIDELKARGGTHLEEALRYAFESFPKENGRLQIVCVITDGEPTLGMTRPDDLVKLLGGLNDDGKRVFCFGIGVELNSILLERIASKHRGAVEFALPEEQLEIKLSNFYDKIDQPVLTGISADFRSLDVRDVYPKPLPDLFRGDELTIVGRFKNSGKHTILIRGTYQGKERIFEYALEFRDVVKDAAGNDVTARNDFLPRRWAAQKIGFLLEGIRLNGETKELTDEVVRLSKRYGILTPYTSYLVVEDETRLSAARPRGGNAERRRAVNDVLRRGLGRDAFGGSAGSPAGATEDGTEVERASTSEALRERLRPEAAALRKAGEADGIDAAKRVLDLKAGRLQEADRYAAQRINREESLMRQVAGRTFYFQGNRWVDASLVASSRPGDVTKTPRVVKYLSDDYFALLKQHAGIGRVLSLGSRLMFRWGDEVLSIEP